MRWRLTWLDEADSEGAFVLFVVDVLFVVMLGADADADAGTDGSDSRWAADSFERRAASRRATYRELRR